MKIVFFSLIFLLSLPSVLALPQFFGALPQNNSYIFGRDTDVFSVNITDSSFDLTSAKLHIRVYEPLTTLYNSSLSCTNYVASNWYCNGTVTGFGSLASDGKTFIYYFDAANTTGNTNTSENYFITIDRSPPQINFINPTNGNYTKGIFKIKMNLVDILSGVNSSTLKYSFDNSTFLDTEFLSWLSDPFYLSVNWWDTTSYSNNQSVTIYAKAKDNLGNENITYINVSIDNEIPRAIIIHPSSGSILSGTAYLEINAQDSYSGISLSSVFYRISNITNNSMRCWGIFKNLNCSADFVTASIDDGTYILYFNVNDSAGNNQQNSTSVTIDNGPPSITITSPQTNSFVSGTVPISTTVQDSGSGISSVKIIISGTAYDMSCSGTVNSYSCSYNWNTATFSDGNYTIVINATDKSNRQSTQTLNLIIDNTLPNLAVVLPTQQFLKGIVIFEVNTSDSNGIQTNSVKYQIYNNSSVMGCHQIGSNKKMICNSTISTTLISDGFYALTFSSTDMANNTKTSSMTINIDNLPPILSSVTVTPIISKDPTTFKISAVLVDAGSSVNSAKAKITYPDGKFIDVTLLKTSTGYWEYSFFSDNQGKHLVDITATDTDANSVTFTNVSAFYLGSLNCGNGVCDKDENYCFCSKDCPAPTCSANQYVNCASGIPTCSEKPVCGNGKCDEGEDCSNCSKDCGLCQTTTTSPGSVQGIPSNYLIIAVLGVGVAAAIVFLVYKELTKPKGVYPGFKPKKEEI